MSTKSLAVLNLFCKGEIDFLGLLLLQLGKLFLVKLSP